MVFGTREDRFGDFVTSGGGVGDFNMQAGPCCFRPSILAYSSFPVAQLSTRGGNWILTLLILDL